MTLPPFTSPLKRLWRYYNVTIKYLPVYFNNVVSFPCLSLTIVINDEVKNQFFVNLMTSQYGSVTIRFFFLYRDCKVAVKKEKKFHSLVKNLHLYLGCRHRINRLLLEVIQNIDQFFLVSHPWLCQRKDDAAARLNLFVVTTLYQQQLIIVCQVRQELLSEKIRNVHKRI